MTTTSNRKPKKSRLRLGLLLSIALVVIVAGGAYFVMGGESNESTTVATMQVRPMDLTISLVEGGSLRAPKSFDVTSPIEGSATILTLAEEGSLVEEGDLLVELDVSGKTEELTRQDIAVKNALASWTEAKESLDIQKNVNASNEREAELTLEFAKTDLRKFLGERLAGEIDRLSSSDGILGLGASDSDLRAFLLSDLEPTAPTPPGPGDESLLPDSTDQEGTPPEMRGNLNYEGEWGQQRRAAQTDIQLANEELTRAITRENFTEELERQGYVTSDELIADKLARTRREIDLELAYSKQQVLLDYTGPSTLKLLLADVAKADDELIRVRAKSRAELAKAEANLDAKLAVLELEKESLERLREQINSAKIYAPYAGLVVYATNSRGGRGRDERPLEVGSDVRERQLILSIPDASTMIADTKVHESALAKVRAGLGALVTIDAMADKHLQGRVSKVGVLPDSQSSWLNPDLKVYSTEITIHGETTGLRPGMSCKVEILIEKLQQVLALPLYAVQRRGRVNYVLVQRPDGELEARIVEVGLNNDKLIEIQSGLEAGETVLLGRPENAPVPPVPDDEENENNRDQLFLEAIDEPAAEQERRESRQGGRGNRAEEGEGPGGGEGRRGMGAMGNLSEEDRKRLENMTDEERRAEMRKLFGGRNGGGGPGGNGGNGGNGGRRGGRSRDGAGRDQ
ncbi:MAG: efflux RND transporter periplasmic adaptor subunit [Planctomycetota bacterium]